MLESGDKYGLNEDGSELTVKDVKKVDEGDYACIARNKAGEKAQEVSLNVFGKKVGFSLLLLGPEARGAQRSPPGSSSSS